MSPERVPRLGVERDGHMRWCSEIHADVSYQLGKHDTLITLARGLRWRASRIEREKLYAPDYLRTWADKAIRDVEAIGRRMREWTRL